MQKISFFLCILLLSSLLPSYAQQGYWQQQANYQMNIDFDAEKHQFQGKQKLVYTNNSPDVLDKVFYHLYFNAFQPGSMMDVRSRTISDPDQRVRDRIASLKPNEIGYHRIKSLKQDGKALQYEVVGTILEVKLATPIAPQKSSTFEMEFESQVPIQIRRNGRNNSEGIDYSMAQWYPKMAEYDIEGWHAHPYIGREFHGVWGNFDVKITIDSAYTLAGTGTLQNPQEIGKGYESKGKAVKRPAGKRLTWHFKAENVHDFMWAADPDYIHTQTLTSNGTLLRFFYQKPAENNWKLLPDYMVKFFDLMNQKFGTYPYKEFSFIQGGDGGMEYPMATLIVGNIPLRSLVSVAVHEAAHNWFYGVLATNESLYHWMDEGFTSYAQDFIMDKLFNTNAANPFASSYNAYFNLVKSGLQEPMSTHADHFNTNRAYSTASYSLGTISLHQLGYVIGQEAFDKGMLNYFNTWKFKHPTMRDFKRVMEKTSGLELDWYFEYWVNSTKTIDYGIKQVSAEANKTKIVLERKGDFPMPTDLLVTLKNGQKVHYYIPLEMMRGEKKEKLADSSILLQDWGWVYPEYHFVADIALADIVSMEIDPSGRMADVEKGNNSYPFADVNKQGGKK